MKTVIGLLPRLGREQRLYATAHATGQATQWLLHAALVLVVATGDELVLGLGALVAARLLPSLLFGIPGGLAVDRMGATRGYVLGAVLRGLSILPIFIFGVSAWPAVAVSFLYSSASQIFTPGEMALIHRVWRERHAQAHVLLVVLQKGGQVVGLVALAPALYFAGGPLAMFAGAVAGFAALTGATLLVVRRAVTAQTDAGREGERRRPAFEDTLRLFRDLPLVRKAVTLLALRSAILYSVMIGLPAYLSGPLEAGGPGFWTVAVAGIVGGCLGLAIGSRLSAQRLPDVMCVSWHAVTVSLVALAVASQAIGIAVATVAALTLGLGLSLALVSGKAALTSSTPSERQAGVFAAQLWATDLLTLLPMAAVGVSLATLGVRETVAVLALASFAMHLAIGGGVHVLEAPLRALSFGAAFAASGVSLRFRGAPAAEPVEPA